MKRTHAPHPAVVGAQTGSPDADRTGVACRPAGEVLGAGHPLARADEALRAVARQSAAAGTLVAAAAVAWAAGATWARPVTAAAGVTLVALAAVAGLLLGRRRAEAVALIARGGEDVPLRAVAAQRERLLGDRRRAELARTLEYLAEVHLRAHPPTRTRPLGQRTAVAPAAADLHAVASVLRERPCRAHGVAVAQRLISAPGTPLYADDARALRSELRRICYLLGT
jgi:hypothetical protein